VIGLLNSPVPHLVPSTRIAHVGFVGLLKTSNTQNLTFAVGTSPDFRILSHLGPLLFV